ncbi:MAG: hypothetical protein HC840_00375 [Leptolyngbyaceae cyanobacterium RM2_2_4]|nr:hypothetical protein [Leptolyngbyaceae cyanobacterium RM2_2_4]
MSKEKFVELAKKMEKQQEELNATREELTAVMLALGIDTYAQDPETLAVYKIIKPLGTFTYYKDIDYKRTALEGERGGTVLAKKEAEEAGFVLK